MTYSILRMKGVEVAMLRTPFCEDRLFRNEPLSDEGLLTL